MSTIAGTDKDDILRGTDQSEVIEGLNGADSFHWSSGKGNDTYHGGAGGEKFDPDPYAPGNPGGDRLSLDGTEGAQITFSSTDGGQVDIGANQLTFTGIERVFGTEGNDIVRGAGAELNTPTDGIPAHGLSIFTRGGADSIEGSRFDDIIDAGSGRDTIDAGDGNDFVHSSTGDDVIDGGGGNENIRWGSGDVNHNPGNDTISGGDGSDLINIWIKEGDITPQNEATGIPGASVTIDSIDAAGSFAGVARSTIGGEATLHFSNFELGWTHAGNDSFTAARATSAVNGPGVNFSTRWGHDRVTGSRGRDTLDGSIGQDSVEGGQGDDQIWIGDGEAGDGDVDVVVFRDGDGHDTVYGFDPGIDVLDLGGLTYRASEVLNGTLLTLANGETILLHGVFDFI